jgi:AcrR family transcriptional regulator
MGRPPFCTVRYIITSDQTLPRRGVDLLSGYFMARPRQFDEEIVLDKAMDVFWRLGYEGASLSELTNAMGMNAPSIYAAFGSKRGLMQKVLDRYSDRRSGFRLWAFAAATNREVAERVLMGAVDWLTDPSEPLGCLLMQVGAARGPDFEELGEEVRLRRERLLGALIQRFRKSSAVDELPPGMGPTATARFIYTVFVGLSVEAAAGTSRKELRQVASHSLAAWPKAETLSSFH